METAPLTTWEPPMYDDIVTKRFRKCLVCQNTHSGVYNTCNECYGKIKRAKANEQARRRYQSRKPFTLNTQGKAQ